MSKPANPEEAKQNQKRLKRSKQNQKKHLQKNLRKRKNQKMLKSLKIPLN